MDLEINLKHALQARPLMKAGVHLSSSSISSPLKLEVTSSPKQPNLSISDANLRREGIDASALSSPAFPAAPPGAAPTGTGDALNFLNSTCAAAHGCEDIESSKRIDIRPNMHNETPGRSSQSRHKIYSRAQECLSKDNQYLRAMRFGLHSFGSDELGLQLDTSRSRTSFFTEGEKLWDSDDINDSLPNVNKSVTPRSETNFGGKKVVTPRSMMYGGYRRKEPVEARPPTLGRDHTHIFP